MEHYYELSQQELLDIEAGGFLSGIAGALAGGIIGTFIGLIPAVVVGDMNIIAKTAITGATVLGWVGAGCPVP